MVLTAAPLGGGIKEGRPCVVQNIENIERVHHIESTARATNANRNQVNGFGGWRMAHGRRLHMRGQTKLFFVCMPVVS